MMALLNLHFHVVLHRDYTTQLVAETNRYYHWPLDILDEGPSPQPVVMG